MTEQKVNYATSLYFFSKFFEMLDEDIRYTNASIPSIMKYAIMDKGMFMEFVFNTENGSLIRMVADGYD